MYCAVCRALARKAWLETRTRFVTGAVVVLVLCTFMVLIRPRMLVQWPLDKVQHPEWRDPPWWDRVHTDYAFFLWHYLYRDMLQKAFMVFAVLLGVGGVRREAAHGTAGFTLALPVSRRTLLAVRAAIGAAELLALGVTAVVTLLATSTAIGVAYEPVHAVLHAALLVAGALALLAGALCLSSIVEGEHAPALVGLAAVGMFNYAMAPFAAGAPVPRTLRAVDLVHVMAGGSGGASGDVPWIGIATTLCVGAAALAWAFHHSARHDF